MSIVATQSYIKSQADTAREKLAAIDEKRFKELAIEVYEQTVINLELYDIDELKTRHLSFILNVDMPIMGKMLDDNNFDYVDQWKAIYAVIHALRDPAHPMHAFIVQEFNLPTPSTYLGLRTIITFIKQRDYIKKTVF